MEARNAVIRGVLRLGWHPTAMEFFPATAGTSWELIQDFITQSDYFVVLLGGRAGTLFGDTKTPIAEMEYDFALQHEIPIARFVHEEPNELGPSEREGDSLHQAAFVAFRNKLMTRQCALWRTHADLIEQVSPTLTHLHEAHPRPGWIRGTYAGLVDDVSSAGISRVFSTRDAAMPVMLDDIRASKHSCWISAAVYVNALIKAEGHEDLIETFQAVATRARDTKTEYQLTFSSLSADVSESGLAGKQNRFLLECWSRKEKDGSVDSLRQRIVRGSSAFEQLAIALSSYGSAIRLQRRFFRNYLIPHSLVVIDASIAYVTFYDWSTPTGQRSLTIRFTGGRWGRKFIEEAQIISSEYSYRDIRVIAFDFDGVIADSMNVQASAWHHAARALNVDPHVEEQLISNFWAGAAGMRMFENVQTDNTTMESLRRVKDEEFERLEPSVRKFDGSDRVLRLLKGSNQYKLAVATTAKRERAEKFLRANDLEVYFDALVTDYDITKGKPHPDMLIEIAVRLGCQPWQVCLVGDTNTDYLMSRAAGADFVFFKSHEAHGVRSTCPTAASWDKLATLFLGISG